MGWDLSMSATGVAFPDGSTAVVKPRGEGDTRLLSIERQAETVVRVARPQLVVIEDDPGVFRGAAAKVIPMVHATARLVLMRAGIPYVLVNQSTLKVYATGQKGADKAAMTLAAYKRMGVEFRDDNEADAAWLRAAGHAAYGESVVQVPKAHTEALRAVVWPVLPGAAAPLAPREGTRKPTRRRSRAAA